VKVPPVGLQRDADGLLHLSCTSPGARLFVQIIKFSKPITGRSIKRRALSEQRNEPWTSAAEISIIRASPDESAKVE